MWPRSMWNGVKGLFRSERGRVAELESVAARIEEDNAALRELQRTLEEQVDARTHQLSQAHQQLSAALGRTVELERVKTEFFANLSHELRTPLTLILGPTERLLASSAAEKRRADLALVVRNARILSQYVNDLLDFARHDAAKLHIDYANSDLVRLTRRVATDFKSLASDRGIEFEIQTPDELEAQVDPAKVQRILFNLLSNALNFSPEGGQVGCVLEKNAEQAIWIVTDSGTPISAKARANVFERFHQIDERGTQLPAGTGLGLAIVRDFVELHRGHISVEESSSGGARFRVELPRVAPPGALVQPNEISAAHQALPPAAPVDNVQPSNVTRGDFPLVLIVEDNPEMANFLAATLTPDFRTATAATGLEGLRQTIALKPDLVLTDIVMPEMSGADLLQQIRSRNDLVGMPVVLISARPDEAERIHMLRAGAQDYVTKPFSPEELRARLKNLTSMKRAGDLIRGELDSQSADLHALALELTRRRRELQTAVDAVSVARDHANRSNESKKTFLQTVSHELQVPLTTLESQFEQLRHSPESIESREKVAATLARLRHLIESLFHFTQIESDQFYVNIQQVDLRELLREVVEERRHDAVEKNIEIRLVADSAAVLRSDPRLLRLIFVNLLVNAVRSTDYGGVTVSLTLGQEAYSVVVSDNGPGLSSDEQTGLLSTFTVAPEKYAPGVDLGLTMVREMCHAIGASIDFKSHLGLGTTFTVVVPIGGHRLTPGSEAFHAA